MDYDQKAVISSFHLLGFWEHCNIKCQENITDSTVQSAKFTMTTRAGRRTRKNSDGDEYVDIEDAPSTARPAFSRRANAKKLAAAEEPVDSLTPEEQYLMRVFRRFRQQTPASLDNAGQSVSPVRPDSAGRRGPLPATTGKVAADPDVARFKLEEKPPPHVPQPTDTASRLKMMLEKKRKEAAGPRAGSAAAAGAGVQRKAKISKVAGASPSPASSTRLDSVKYPASGLLLRREYRSFQESEEEGERVYLPAEPLVRELTNFGIPDPDGGKKQLNETLVMRITVPTHSQSWGINISPQDHRDFEEVLFHFNPRRRFVAMNNREDNIWGQQEKYVLPRWPDMFNVSIILGVQIDKTGFHVAVDGKYCATFHHRSKVPARGDVLVLQVMTADDYGTNLGVVVHEIWWGHKDTMPGLPGAPKERKPAPARSTDPWRGQQSDDNFLDLHVGNLPSMRSPEDQEMMRKRLMDLFQPYGAIQVRIFHREKDFGFIKFRDHSGAAKAMDELGAEVIQGRTIRLSKAATR